MSERVTKDEVVRAVERYRRAAVYHGIFPARDVTLSLDPGSPQDGKAWRLWVVNDDSSQSAAPGTDRGWPDMGFIGSSAREARDTLWRIVEAWSVMEQAHRVDTATADS